MCARVTIGRLLSIRQQTRWQFDIHLLLSFITVTLRATKLGKRNIWVILKYHMIIFIVNNIIIF